ncbi:hypothetical protein HS088_TW09G00420 [Tripterygium wilfordii]|uniref:Integrator complex subunit 7 n=1 Tax=Tripterygium wilfordii TaxID=458696 RepID=A0A7J7D7M7_TRIWF|nr:uncharacterized protein LOC120006445 [Tripterygium wilfordii]XP_038712414.1 uncharacterized protein LOC120006445 [Tripterygium wilfordii]XP_038712415.1 uncharacterized protein LOC120006445 [Tripterygium wilfordii]XP_038712416.1 uncharacterized protein LOC120006445 [Tripterygium wilfordii]KAF5742375.1 hypothetical protein HS088_TW09G00420 [Tripterygium wilfordii]
MMERISAACAMEWGIELEKALRSRKPGLSVLAILKMGPRLVQWSGEPEPTMAVYDMFGLVPGEDRLFCNSILLRLVDAFKSGDKPIRLSVVKVFLSEYRHRRKKKKSKQCKGILSKGRLHNHVEMLKRAKFVFDTGDVESRALALILFGCWVEFAKDNAHIRYLILSSLVSSDLLEVKASLFAAGCFCELADDFAAVVLEILLNGLASSSSLAVRLAVARIFAKLGCSYSNANKAYKAGLKLLSGSSDEDFLTAMLVSLSKLASKSTLLLPEQVDLLLVFLSQERTLRMRAAALKCLRFLTTKGVYHPVSASVKNTLVGIADDHGLPVTMQCEVLQIWHKMILYTSPDVPCDDMLEFSHLFAIVENSTEPPILSKSLLAIRILKDVLTKLRRRIGTGSSKVGSPSLSWQVISLIIDQMIFLLKSLLEQSQSEFRELREVQSLLIPLSSLVGEHPYLGVLVLDKIYTFIQSLMDVLGSVMAASPEGSLVQDTQVPERRKSRVIVLKLVCFVYVMLVNFLENLYEAGGINTQVLEKLKILIECIHRCKLFNFYTHTLYSLLLHYQSPWGCMLPVRKETCVINKTVIKLQNYFAEPEVFSLECAKKMFEEHDNWSAYKAGKYAACQGAWATATFIFMQLVKKVQSGFFCCWLKSLAQFAYSEWKIKLFVLPNQGSSSVDRLEMKEFLERLFLDGFGDINLGATGNLDQVGCTEVFVEAYNVLCSSREILESSCTVQCPLSFQLWFMSKRAKVLETVADTLKILGSIPSDKDNLRNAGNVKDQFSVELLNISRKLTQISLRLKRLAQEFDLMVSSFIGMDSRSSSILSTLALGCSLLAFSSGFACFFPNLLGSETFGSFVVEISGSCLHAMLTQDLAGRLWHKDSEICRDLCILSEACAQPKNCFHWQSRSRIFNVGGGMRDTLTICRDAVSHFLCLQNQANKMQEELPFQVIEDGLQLLSNIVMKWTCILFKIPKYYFEFRPCIGSELFAFNTRSSIPNEISVVPGFHLSLNLCLQLRNVPPDQPVSLTKLHCILCCRVSFQEPRQNGEKREPEQQYSRPWKDENAMVELNEKLFCYVSKCSKRSDRENPAWDNDVESGIVNSFVSFELNERGQGFSSCLLDVSHFPLGSYRIKWHSCCIDKQGRYWSLLPLNEGPVFEVRNPVVA